MAKQSRCRGCRRRAAVVENALCQGCFDAAVAEVWKVMGSDVVALSADDLRHLVLSFFVGW